MRLTTSKKNTIILDPFRREETYTYTPHNNITGINKYCSLKSIKLNGLNSLIKEYGLGNLSVCTTEEIDVVLLPCDNQDIYFQSC